MSDDIVCYVLRNSPLRVVKVSRITSDSTEMAIPPILTSRLLSSPNTVTLESIFSECSLLTESVLRRTPDNQLIAFWSEVAFFCVAGPMMEENTTYNNAEFFYFEVYSASVDDSGATATTMVGKTDYCTPGNENDAICQAGPGEFEFVLLATNTAPGISPEKIVLQVIRRDGVAYRICIARVAEDQWMKAGPERELIVLG